MYLGPIDLVLDIGNTRTKWGVFKDGYLLRNGVAMNGDIRSIHEGLAEEDLDMIALGSVATPEEGLLRELRTLAPVLVLEGTSPAPIRNAYDSPGTLGADRLANVVAAVHRMPNRPLLVIDAGTCITYDVCDVNGTYLGGAISPGLRMRAKAMHTFSARLPEVVLEGSPVLWGGTTTESLIAGIHFGIIGEMEGFIRRSGTEHPGSAVLITGGDAVRFARGLESGIFAHPYLTLEGYHALLVHHRTLNGGALSHGTSTSPGAGSAD